MKLQSQLIAGAFLALAGQLCFCLGTLLGSELETKMPKQHVKGSLLSETPSGFFIPTAEDTDLFLISREPTQNIAQGIGDEFDQQDMDNEGTAVLNVEQELLASDFYEEAATKERAARRALLKSMVISLAVVFVAVFLLFICTGGAIFSIFTADLNEDGSDVGKSFLSNMVLLVSLYVLGALAGLVTLAHAAIRGVMWVVKLGVRLYALVQRSREQRQNKLPESVPGVPPHK